ncbi:hypothetical protein [Marinobacterium aestuariivivens]|uniref:Uncharacterized protein n=1 Tax=Marinobacterium aestuariivivens TaxID=1698799 RepID=A0ABW2A4P1_9GAMM
MDLTAILIIAVATATAIAFKVFVYRRIGAWMDRDLIQGLSAGDSERRTWLEQHYRQLRAEGLSRRKAQARLQQLAEGSAPSD